MIVLTTDWKCNEDARTVVFYTSVSFVLKHDLLDIPSLFLVHILKKLFECMYRVYDVMSTVLMSDLQ